ADERALRGLGVAALLELGDQRLQPLDVLGVHRDADDLVVRRLGLGLAHRRRQLPAIELLAEDAVGLVERVLLDELRHQAATCGCGAGAWAASRSSHSTTRL